MEWAGGGAPGADWQGSSMTVESKSEALVNAETTPEGKKIVKKQF